VDLLARREAFGYLFMDRASETLYVLKTDQDVDLSEPSIVQVPDPRGNSVAPSTIVTRQTQVIRADILVAPTVVEFYPTRVCNEKCPQFCYFGDRLNTRGNAFPAEHISYLISNLWQAGVFQLVILGGEPFLYQPLPLLLKEAGSRQFVISLSTNGTHWRADVIEQVVEFGVHLNVSFHSHKPDVHDAMVGRDGAFQRTLRTIKRLAETAKPPHISVVLTKENADYIADTVDFLCDVGVRSISILHTQNTGYARKSRHNLLEFSEYVRAARSATRRADVHDIALQTTTNYPFLVVDGMTFNVGSGLAHLLYGHPDGRRVLYVLDDGSVVGTLYQDLIQPQRLGNVITDDLADIWHSNKALERIRTSDINQACLHCVHFAYCRGGPPQDLSSAPSSINLPHCPIYVPDLSCE
jgi:radical SAM protein with 4Fe4S-binding SPASM domain